MTAPFTPATPTRHPILLATPIFRSGLFAADGLNGNIHDITFRNIRILTDGDVPKPAVWIVGVDEAHNVKDMTMDGIYRDGVKLEKDEIEWNVNEFVSDIQFR
jgi:hypothetical protein